MALKQRSLPRKRNSTQPRHKGGTILIGWIGALQAARLSFHTWRHRKAGKHKIIVGVTDSVL